MTSTISNSFFTTSLWTVSAFALLVGTLLLALVLYAAPSPARDTMVTRFVEPLNQTATRQPLSPLVVTVYERVGQQRTTTELRPGDGGDVMDMAYNERLIVVKPQNWFIYTNNGLNFYLISNNVSNRTAQCDLDRQMIAVEFRLLALAERDTRQDETGRFRVACINYTVDNLVRLFGVAANRTYLDLSVHFDRKLNVNAPTLLVDEIVNYLLAHGLV